MRKLKIPSLKTSKTSYNAAYLVLIVVIGTELFNFINSIKLNLIMPTMSNVLNEATVRSWQVSNGTICIRYGNFLWDFLSVAVFMTVIYILWRFVINRHIK